MQLSKRFHTSKIGRRLVIYILLFSSLVTLVLTAFQLYRDYRIDVNSIHSRIEHFKLSDVPSISKALWVVDTEGIATKLQGLKQLPDIQFLEVTDADGSIAASAGTRLDADTIDYSFLLSHEHRGYQLNLGLLHVQASLQGVYQRLLDKAIIILATQAAKTFLVSLFILLIVHQVFTRHLVHIAQRISTHDIEDKPAPLALERRTTRWTENDELEQVLHALNSMQAGLWEAYGRIRDSKEELELAVEERTHELAAINQDLSSFCYSVSHDLRAPLRSIHGFSDLLLEDYSATLDLDGRQYLERVKRASIRMSELIDDLLSLSRVAQLELNFTKVDMSALCIDVRDELEAGAPQRKVQWSIAPDIHAFGDRRLLRILLENLIGNAWKYTLQTPTPNIEFGAKSHEGKKVFYVRDNGAGFDMEYYDKLFQVFQRLHSDPEFEGTGVGLATVERVIRRHKGHIWAEGAVGQGACFYFTLPLSADPVPQGAAQ